MFKGYKYSLILIISVLSTVCAFSQGLVITEINYRSDTVTNKAEFVEIYNNSDFNVDISGWLLDKGVDFQFPAGSTIGSRKYIIVAQDPSAISVPLAAKKFGPFSGKLSNKGDEIILRNKTFVQIDKVKYNSWDEWPSVNFQDTEYSTYDGRSGCYISSTSKVLTSIQKLHPNLPGKHGGSWKAASPTPGASNAVSISSPNIPIANRVSKKPNKPNSGEAVNIEAEFENLANAPGTFSVKLEYQVVLPGSYIRKTDVAYASNWTAISMSDNGIGADSTANNGVYTATIPGSINQHRNLVRYRIHAFNNNGYNEYFPDQNHNESNYAYFVYDGSADFQGYSFSDLDTLPSINLISSTTDINEYIESSNYKCFDYEGQGTVVYNGIVYDHIGYRSRGKGSRHKRVKKNIKIDLNAEHELKPVDDCFDEYDTARGKIALSGGWVNDANGHGLTESLIYKLAELSGGFNKLVDYHQFRIIDGSTEGGLDGDFWGLYMVIEDWGGDMLSEHKLPDGNIYGYKDWSLSHAGSDGPYGESNAAYQAWNTAMGDSKNGCSSCNVPINSQSFYEDNLNLDHYYSNWVMEELVANGETNYPGQHSYREYYNPVTEKWTVQTGDFDETFGMNHGSRVAMPRSDSRTDRYIRGPLKTQLLNYDDFKIEFTNRLRSTIDLLFNPEQLDHLLNSESKHIYGSANNVDWVNLDKIRWSGQTDANGNAINYGNYQEVITWYKNWFTNRSNHLINAATSYNSTSNAGYPSNPLTNPYHVEESFIPNKPAINYAGGAGFPIDDLTFTNSGFSDPQGNGTFAAVEWRVGEWTDPSNAIYDLKCKPKYEITPVWESGQLSNYSLSQDIDGSNLKEGKTYKVRVRHKDNSGRWSHWSDAYTFIAGAPQNPLNYSIVINEIHYSPTNEFGEFVEIINTGSSAVNLGNLKFDNGISHNFDDGDMINPDEYVVLARYPTAFKSLYGFEADYNYGGKLDNGGEVIELVDNFGNIVDSVKYNDKLPWDTIPDNGVYSLALIDNSLDNSFSANWSHQCSFITPKAENDFASCNGLIKDLSALVINEISYRPQSGNPIHEFVEIKNNGPDSLDVTGVTFSGAFSARIDDYLKIGPGEFFIVAKDTSAFIAHFGVPAHAQYTGTLSDNGESIIMKDFLENDIDQVSYSNFPFWNQVAALGQASLGLIDADFDNDTPVNWSNQTPAFTPMQDNTFGNLDLVTPYTLVINEIHYNPSSESVNGSNISGTEYEFIEIKNVGNNLVWLNDIYLGGGINYQFPDFSSLAPGQFKVIAKNDFRFNQKFSVTADGEYDGNLSNTGERITIENLFGDVIDEVTYSSNFPWDPDPANGAYSLGLIDETKSNTIAVNWASQKVDIIVTPRAENIFDNNAVADLSAVIINEIHYNAADSIYLNNQTVSGEAYEFIEIHNTSNSLLFLNELNFSSGINYTFGPSSVILPNGYIVLAKNATRFQQKYGFAPYGQYSESLSDVGELVALEDFFGNDIDQVHYSASSPWDSTPSMGQSSLGFNNSTNSSNIALNWQAQAVKVTPNAMNVFSTCINIIVESNFPQIVSGTKHAVISIETNGIVTNNNNATYKAGNFVELLPGFEVAGNAEFLADIEPCN